MDYGYRSMEYDHSMIITISSADYSDDESRSPRDSQTLGEHDDEISKLSE